MEQMILRTIGMALPGALALLVFRKLSGKGSGGWVLDLSEWIVCEGLALALGEAVSGLIWQRTSSSFFFGAEEGSGIGIMGYESFYELAVYLLLALVIGTIAAFLGRLKLSVEVRELPRDHSPRLPQAFQKGVKVLAWCVALALALGFILYPRLMQEKKKRADAMYIATAKATFEGLNSKVEELLKAGGQPEELSDLEIGEVTVRRVKEDQKWAKGSGYAGYEAVYMADANGDVVYFSFRGKDHATSWSGSTQDEEFRQASGGWNQGKGFGWSGYSLD